MYPVSAISFLIYRRIEEAITKKYSILDKSISDPQYFGFEEI